MRRMILLLCLAVLAGISLSNADKAAGLWRQLQTSDQLQVLVIGCAIALLAIAGLASVFATAGPIRRPRPDSTVKGHQVWWSPDR